MKFATMIPQFFNDGEPVGHVTLEGVYRIFWNQYGGCTVDAVADGYWHDKKEDKLYVDKVRRLTVVTKSNAEHHLVYARLLVRRVGVRLKQKVMYFEHDATGINVVEFLDIDPKENFNPIG